MGVQIQGGGVKTFRPLKMLVFAMIIDTFRIEDKILQLA